MGQGEESSISLGQERLLCEVEAVLVAAGAAMGVDSGLPDQGPLLHLPDTTALEALIAVLPHSAPSSPSD